MAQRIAFLTGGTGFVGGHVARSLHAKGWAVRALVRGDPSPAPLLRDLPLEVVRGDLSASTDLSRACAGCEAIVHVAGLVKARSLETYREVNVRGTERLVRAARAACPDALFLLVSSQAASGPARDGRPIGEQDPARPVSWYGVSKKEGEDVVRQQWEGPWIILRPGFLYGPYDRGLLQAFRLAARGYLPVPGGRFRVQIGYIAEVAVAIATAAARPDLSGRTGFLCDPDSVTLAEVAAAIVRLAPRAARHIPVPDAVVRVAGFLEAIREAVTGKSRPFNMDKAREILAGDWLCDPRPMERDLEMGRPTPLEEGLAKTWNWYREAGWLPTGIL